jgi:hypothetical protein
MRSECNQHFRLKSRTLLLAMGGHVYHLAISDLAKVIVLGFGLSLGRKFKIFDRVMANLVNCFILRGVTLEEPLLRSRCFLRYWLYRCCWECLITATGLCFSISLLFISFLVAYIFVVFDILLVQRLSVISIFVTLIFFHYKKNYKVGSSTRNQEIAILDIYTKK